MNDPAHNAKVAALAEKLWKLARADCDNNVAIMCAALSTALSVSLREYPTDERKKIVAALELAFQRSRSFMTFCGLSQATLIADMADGLGFTSKPAVWVKECPPPAGKGNWWPSGMQMAVYGYTSGAYFADDDPKRSNVFIADAYRFGQPGKNGHPTQTPLCLMERFVRALVPPDGTALDPFMGSGTTGVACAKAGRRFVGIELDPRRWAKPDSMPVAFHAS